MAEALKNKYLALKQRYQAWKQRLVFKTEQEDPLTEILGKGWNELGFHRSIGKFFYGIGLLIPQVIFGLMLLPLIQYTQYRFPEIAGFKFATVGIFAAMYSILDLNLKATINRFVPEYLIKDPRKALAYVSFFIKYQMWSGLFQIAFVGFACTTFMRESVFAYLIWYLLFESVKQYPATLTTFADLIEAFQRFNKAHLVVIYRASFVEPLTQLLGGVLGMIWGMNNPVIGEMYGMTLGWAIGGYVDDFFTFGLGMYWLSKILDEYDIRIRDVYGMKVGRDVWGSALNYSARLWPSTIFGAVMGFFGFMITVSSVPGYLTWVGLVQAARQFDDYVGWSTSILATSQPALSESYNNDKPNLCRFYLASGLKWWGFWFMLLGPLMIFGLSAILQIAFQGGFLDKRWAAISMIIPIIIYIRVSDPFHDVGEKMIHVSNHPEVNTVLGIVGTCLNFFFTWYFLMVLRLGWLGIVLIELPSRILGIVVRLIFVHKKVLRLGADWWRDIAWQAFAVPVIASLAPISLMLVLLNLVWPVVSEGLTGMVLVAAAIPIILLLILGVIFLYLPLYSFLGGWDENTLRDFRKCVPLTGPSLWLTVPILRLVEKSYAACPSRLKRWGHMDIGDAGFEELVQLGRERMAHLGRFQKE